MHWSESAVRFLTRAHVERFVVRTPERRCRHERYWEFVTGFVIGSCHRVNRGMVFTDELSTWQIYGKFVKPVEINDTSTFESRQRERMLPLKILKNPISLFNDVMNKAFGTDSKATVSKLLRDWVERICASPSAEIYTVLNWTELSWTEQGGLVCGESTKYITSQLVFSAWEGLW